MMLLTGFSFVLLLQEAEISASMTSGATRNLDIAQKKGSTILNLKCVDAQVACSISSSCCWFKLFK